MNKQEKAFRVALSLIEVEINKIGDKAFKNAADNERYNNLKQAEAVLEAFQNAITVTA